MPVTLLRVGDALVTVNSVNGNPSKVSTVHRPAPTGDVAIYRGRAAYVAGRGKNKRVILLTRVGDEEGKVVARGDIRSIDLGRSKLAYVDGESRFSNKVRVHLVDLATGRDRVIDQVGSGEMSVADFQKPSFTADNKSLIYSETRWGAGGQHHGRPRHAQLSRPRPGRIFAAGVASLAAPDGRSRGGAGRWSSVTRDRCALAAGKVGCDTATAVREPDNLGSVCAVAGVVALALGGASLDTISGSMRV